MTQAAVSYQIKILEERVGAPLFLRLPRQVELTDHGKCLAPAITEAFETMRNAFASLRKMRRAHCRSVFSPHLPPTGWHIGLARSRCGIPRSRSGSIHPTA